MTIQHLAAFADGSAGGNPAGVMIADALPEPEQMQAIAADLGYSETVFGAPQGDAWRVRYFAPEAEVPFCGHATIALGAALGERFGAGQFRLILNDAEISVKAAADGLITLTSPPVSHSNVPADLLAGVLDLFGWREAELSGDIPPAMGMAGTGKFLLLPLGKEASLRAMRYEQSAGAKLMRAHGLITINLFWRESSEYLHCRNPFAGHGVYEDPATGASASALAGYLRDGGYLSTPFELSQGVDMGVPCRLHVRALDGQGAPVEVAGYVRQMRAS